VVYTILPCLSYDWFRPSCVPSTCVHQMIMTHQGLVGRVVLSTAGPELAPVKMGEWDGFDTRLKRRNRALVGDAIVVDLSSHTVIHIRERVQRQVSIPFRFFTLSQFSFLTPCHRGGGVEAAGGGGDL
jgi:hypothetical protein